MTKCFFCEDRFTNAELKELKEMGEKYARTKECFICPDCYDDFNRLPLEEQFRALLSGNKYEWPNRSGLSEDEE